MPRKKLRGAASTYEQPQTIAPQGCSFISISEIILEGDYTIDHTGRSARRKKGLGPLQSFRSATGPFIMGDHLKEKASCSSLAPSVSSFSVRPA